MAAFMKLKGEDTSKAIVHPQYQPEASKAIVHPQYQPEGDGFMRLDDIKGEFSPSRESLGGSSYSPWDHEVINASDFAPATKDVGWWTVDGADFLDHNHGKRSNWDAICDVGTSIKQDGIELQSDALVQQVNDFAGLINPDSMRPLDFANNQVMFETGLPVEGIGASNPMGIEPNQMMGSISRGDMFAAVSEIRSDNHF